MEIIFAFACLAVLLAVIGFAWAFRSRAAARRLGLEMIQLRDRLARAERYYRGRGPDEAAAGSDIRAPTGAEAVLEARLATLEGRVRDVVVRDLPDDAALAEDPEPTEMHRQVRRHLQREGYARVAFLGATEDGGLLLEAEKGGVTSKGCADVRPDGTVRIRSVSSLRAFP